MLRGHLQQRLVRVHRCGGELSEQQAVLQRRVRERPLRAVQFGGRAVHRERELLHRPLPVGHLRLRGRESAVWQRR